MVVHLQVGMTDFSLLKQASLSSLCTKILLLVTERRHVGARVKLFNLCGLDQIMIKGIYWSVDIINF